MSARSGLHEKMHTQEIYTIDGIRLAYSLNCAVSISLCLPLDR